MIVRGREIGVQGWGKRECMEGGDGEGGVLRWGYKKYSEEEMRVQRGDIRTRVQGVMRKRRVLGEVKKEMTVRGRRNEGTKGGNECTEKENGRKDRNMSTVFIMNVK